MSELGKTQDIYCVLRLTWLYGFMRYRGQGCKAYLVGLLMLPIHLVGLEFE